MCLSNLIGFFFVKGKKSSDTVCECSVGRMPRSYFYSKKPSSTFAMYCSKKYLRYACPLVLIVLEIPCITLRQRCELMT